MIDRSHDLPITRQAKVLNVSRGSVYYRPRAPSTADLALMRRIDELHLDFPFAGSRMLRDLLTAEGFRTGRRHVATLMKRMGIQAVYRKPNTSKPAPGHKIYRKRGRRQTLLGGSLRARLNGPARVDAWRLGCRKVMADQAGAAV